MGHPVGESSDSQRYHRDYTDDSTALRTGVSIDGDSWQDLGGQQFRRRRRPRIQINIEKGGRARRQRQHVRTADWLCKTRHRGQETITWGYPSRAPTDVCARQLHVGTNGSPRERVYRPEALRHVQPRGGGEKTTPPPDGAC